MADATSSGTAADAAHRRAIAAAEGDGVAQNWSAALEHLRDAAELGSRLAQAELVALSGEWQLAHDIFSGDAAADAWRSTDCGSIDLTQWLEPLRSADVSQSPRVAVVKDVARFEACDWLIARARQRLKPAQVYEAGDGRHHIAAERTNTLSFFPPPDRDLILALLRARIAQITGLPVLAMESPHILHYGVGEEFRPHFDTPEVPDATNFKQRVVTFLLVLNEGYEGGETSFPAIDARWKGRKGCALFFWNVEPDGRRDRRTLHAGRPVTQGEKWLLSQWIGHPAG